MYVNLNKHSNVSVKILITKAFYFMKIELFVFLKNPVTQKTIFIKMIDKCILNSSFKNIF